MRTIGKIAGLYLVAVFVMSMVAAGTSSAAPHWSVCLPSHAGSTATKWSSEQCSTAASGGSWEWSELKTTEAVRTAESLKLEAKSAIGEVEIKCAILDTGWIGPKGTDQTTTITTDKCEAGTNCEKVEGITFFHLPWNSELKETEGGIHDTIRNGGNGEPGWEMACKVLGKIEENTCASEKGLVVLENKNTPGGLAALLVLANFINPNKPKANCTATGSETGNVSGSTAISLSSGRGLRVDGGKFLPHWYKEGAPLAEGSETGGLAVKTGTGNHTFSITDSENKRQSKCKMEDSGKIWNPTEEEAGKGSIESVTFSGCASADCTETPELKAEGLPWKMVLVRGNPILAEIEKMELSIICKGTSQGKYTGSVSLETLNGEGKGEAACIESTHTTFFEFNASEDVLKSGTAKGSLEGKDCIWGKAANERITVSTP